MLGVTVPERSQYYRVALGELARISDHLTCNGAMAMELGAFTPFLWNIRAREMIFESPFVPPSETPAVIPPANIPAALRAN